MTNLTMLVRNRPRLTKQALDSIGLPQPKSEQDARCVGWSKRSGMPQLNLTVWCDRWADDMVNAMNAGPHRAWTETEYWVPGQIAMGTGELRNAVIKASEQRFGRGDYLYLSDNDVFFKPGWLETLICCYERAWHDGFRVLGGYNHPFHRPVSTIYTADAYAIHEVNALATQSMLMRWSVWDDFGPFCQTPVDRVCQSEDVDLSNRIRKAGRKVGVVSPALIVSTGITNTFGERIPGWQAVAAEAPAGVVIE